MRAEKVVSYLLNNDSGVTTIVGEKIFDLEAEQGTKAPMLVFAKNTVQRTPDLDLTVAIVRAQIDVLCIARTIPELKELAEAVRLALSYKQGSIAGVDVIETQPIDEEPDEHVIDIEEKTEVFPFLIVHTE